jgi:hypothetical protein
VRTNCRHKSLVYKNCQILFSGHFLDLYRSGTYFFYIQIFLMKEYSCFDEDGLGNSDIRLSFRNYLIWISAEFSTILIKDFYTFPQSVQVSARIKTLNLGIIVLFQVFICSQFITIFPFHFMLHILCGWNSVVKYNNILNITTALPFTRCWQRTSWEQVKIYWAHITWHNNTHHFNNLWWDSSCTCQAVESSEMTMFSYNNNSMNNTPSSYSLYIFIK